MGIGDPQFREEKATNLHLSESRQRHFLQPIAIPQVAFVNPLFSIILTDHPVLFGVIIKLFLLEVLSVELIYVGHGEHLLLLF